MPKAKDGIKVCTRCHKDLPVSEFFRNKGRPDGLMAFCKKCDMRRPARNKLPISGRKVCPKCKKEKGVSDFWKNRDGLQCRCKDCTKEDREHYTAPTSIYLRMIDSALRRGLDVLLSFDEWFSVINGKACHYCGGALPKQGSGIDRKDSAAAYSIENCVPCCSDCNWTFGDRFTYPEKLLLAPTLKAIRIARSCRVLLGGLESLT